MFRLSANEKDVQPDSPPNDSPSVADEHQSAEYTFRGDGTFTGQLAQDSKVVWTYAGKWSLAGDTLNYEYTKSSVERIPVGTTDHDKLVEVTKEHYTIEARDGSKRKYSKIP